MTSCYFHPSIQATSSHGSRPEAASPTVTKRKVRREGNRSRVGRALLLQMLVSGAAVHLSGQRRREEIITPSAAVEEQSTLRSPLLNGVVDDWSAEPSSQDWDGRQLDGGAQSKASFLSLPLF